MCSSLDQKYPSFLALALLNHSHPTNKIISTVGGSDLAIRRTLAANLTPRTNLCAISDLAVSLKQHHRPRMTHNRGPNSPPA